MPSNNERDNIPGSFANDSNNNLNRVSEGDDLLLPSQHLSRFRGMSQERLMSYVSIIKDKIQVDAVVTTETKRLVDDFMDTLAVMVLETKQEIKSLKLVNTKLATNFTPQDGNEPETSGSSKDYPRHYKLQNSPFNILVGQDEDNLSAIRPDGVQLINLNRLVKKPAYFDGIKPMPREWIDEYIDAIEDNCWNDQTAKYYFKHFLKGEASLWFKFSVRPKLKEDSTFDTIYKLFEFQFLGRAEKERVTLLLDSLRMKSDERVSTFVPKIQQYLYILNPNLTEIEIVHTIERKLRANYADAIIDAEPKTVKELMHACRKAEAKADLAKAARERNRNLNYKDDSDSDDNQSDKEKVIRPRCGKDNHENKDYNDKDKINKHESKQESSEKVTHEKGTNKAVHAIQTNTLSEEELSSSDEVTVTTMTKQKYRKVLFCKLLNATITKSMPLLILEQMLVSSLTN